MSHASREYWQAADKAALGDGPWRDEPDRDAWIDGVTGYICAIERNRPFGHLCGYVALPEGHPWHGRKHSELQADVHGGITYAACLPRHAEHGPLWLIGFHCGNFLSDIMPALGSGRGCGPLSFPGAVYRTFGYVREQCISLAAQAAAAVPPYFECPCCGARNVHPDDLRERYCPRCHDFTGTPDLGPAHMQRPCPARGAARTAGYLRGAGDDMRGE